MEVFLDLKLKKRGWKKDDQNCAPYKQMAVFLDPKVEKMKNIFRLRSLSADCRSCNLAREGLPYFSKAKNARQLNFLQEISDFSLQISSYRTFVLKILGLFEKMMAVGKDYTFLSNLFLHGLMISCLVENIVGFIKSFGFVGDLSIMS